MRFRVGFEDDFLSAFSLTLEEARRIAFHWVRHQPLEDVQQLAHAGTRLRRGEADRYQVTGAQRLFERVVQLLGREFFALLEIEFHELVVYLDDLVDDLGVCRGHVTERGFGAFGLEEAVHHARAVSRGQVQRQALGSEGVPDIGQQLCQVRALRVDLVDDDHPAQPLFFAAFIMRWAIISTPPSALITTAAVSTAGSTETARP